MKFRLLFAFLIAAFSINAQCLTDNFNSGYGNWSGSGTYQNATAGLTGNGTGFNTNGDQIITNALLTNPQTLTLWLARSSSTANKTLSIQYSTSNTGPWTSARDILVGEVTTTHQEFTVNLNLTGDYYLRIAMTQRSGGSYYLDDVEVICGSSVTPNVVLNSSNPSVVSSNIVQGVDNHVIYAFDVSSSLSSAVLNQVDFTTTGTYAASKHYKF